ncbi:hypothetical protein [Micromonospora sp. NPDC005806]|uniref:hypothetical protein n=1 Tax=Micromonospora sp. NPDC005806 TaxID=3364234 RepID=UPI00367AC955
MDNGRHNPRSEAARQHRCRCNECGGSQHGVQGWLDQVSHDHQFRQRERERFESGLVWTRHYPRRLEQSRHNQEISTDLARVDIADWLAVPPPKGSEFGYPYPSPVQQVTAFAEVMTRGAWREITTELHRATADPSSVKRELTNHGWCDLLVGLVRAIEVTRQGFDSIPDKVKRLVLGSATQAERPHVTEAVVGLIVDKVWHAFQAAASGASHCSTSSRTKKPYAHCGSLRCSSAPRRRSTLRYANTPCSRSETTSPRSSPTRPRRGLPSSSPIGAQTAMASRPSSEGVYRSRTGTDPSDCADALNGSHDRKLTAPTAQARRRPACSCSN